MNRLATHIKTLCAGVLLVGTLSSQGCVTSEVTPADLFAPTNAQMQVRSLQTRTFDLKDLKDRNTTMRGVITSLQDLGFIIERANESLGFVTATRSAEPSSDDIVTITVTVHQESAETMSIRANTIYNNKPLDDAKVYQNYFAALRRVFYPIPKSTRSS
jgi:hypothetical protein